MRRGRMWLQVVGVGSRTRAKKQGTVGLHAPTPCRYACGLVLVFVWALSAFRSASPQGSLARG